LAIIRAIPPQLNRWNGHSLFGLLFFCYFWSCLGSLHHFSRNLSFRRRGRHRFSCKSRFCCGLCRSCCSRRGLCFCFG